MTKDISWEPTCTVEALQVRAKMLAAVRLFFADRKYLEVETPLLSGDIVVDAHLHPFTFADTEDGAPLYLQTSPEAGMKRLLAAGCGSIFQVTRSFRLGERGSRHNPEFTMIEWYGDGTTYHDQMRVTQELIQAMAQSVGAPQTESRWSDNFDIVCYNEAFKRTIGSEVLDLTDVELRALAERVGVACSSEASWNRDDLLNMLLAEFVEPTLGSACPQFVCDYPLSQAALATRNPDDPRTACRFELYDRGLELCNGYQELTDPTELTRRDVAQNDMRSARGSAALPGASRMMSAMKAGLPSCSGVALGFDRVVMAVTGAKFIDEVIPFPIERA